MIIMSIFCTSLSPLKKKKNTLKKPTQAQYESVKPEDFISNFSNTAEKVKFYF